MKTPFLIGIAGPSGSGKSALAHRLALAYDAPIISLDHYYRDLAHLSLAERASTNFDEPAAIDLSLLLSQIQSLRAGQAVEIPNYDFAQHTRAATGDRVTPHDIIIVEGLFTLYWHELLNLLDTRVFVDLDDHSCFERRAERDLVERGRTRECVERQYRTTVRPMAETYILPTKCNADVVVRGDWNIEASVSAVMLHCDAVLSNH